MQGIEDIIIQLLLRHNCVVVPGFGGFVSKQVASELDFTSGTIHPPKKALLFNRFLLNDDGLLLAEYARQYGLYYEEAKQKLQNYTDTLHKDLLAGQVIKLPKLGTFSRNTDGQILFEQDRFFNLLLSSYGLVSLSFVPQVEQQKEEAPIIQISEKPVKQIKWARIAAAACLLPLAFYSFWIPTQTTALQSGLFSTKDFNPMHRKSAPTYHKTALPSLDRIELQEKDALSWDLTDKAQVVPYEWLPGMDLNIELPAAPKVSQPKIVQSQNSMESNYAFHFIVGCFSNLQNAQNLQLKLKRDGFDAILIENGPLTKVSAGGAQNEVQLQQIQQHAAAQGLQGWIFKN